MATKALQLPEPWFRKYKDTQRQSQKQKKHVLWNMGHVVMKMTLCLEVLLSYFLEKIDDTR